MNEPETTALPDRRTQRTQQALMEALLELLKTRHYDAITVKDIIAQANVGRSTFYAHYQTKDDLLKGGFERVLDLLMDHVDWGDDHLDLKINTAPMFRHAQGHAELYRTLSWGTGLELITQQGLESLSAKFQQRLKAHFSNGRQPNVPISTLSYSFAGGLLVLLKWWQENGMPETPERMDAIFQQLVMPGIRAALGLT